jgi:hypothetical protein
LRGEDGLRAVEAAVSEVTRRPFSALRSRGPGRDLLVAAARALVDAPVGRVAALAGVDGRTVRRLKGARRAEVRVVERLILDPRFPGLPDGDLRICPAGSRTPPRAATARRSGCSPFGCPVCRT